MFIDAFVMLDDGRMRVFAGVIRWDPTTTWIGPARLGPKRVIPVQADSEQDHPERAPERWDGLYAGE